MTKIVCTSCKGAKKLRMAGLMRRSCSKCLGVGYMTLSDENLSKALSSVSIDIVKKRGRKKKEEL